MDCPELEAGTRQDKRPMFIRDISDAVSLRNDSVRFVYCGQFNGHHISPEFKIRSPPAPP